MAESKTLLSHPFSDDAAIEKAVLSNGLTVLIDRDPRCRCAALAICVLGGVRDEPSEKSGVTHLLEHLLFKQSSSYSSAQISAMIDELGGDINAFTDVESLCLVATVPAADLSKAFAFLAELLLKPAFSAADLDTEKQIIAQEIMEANDNPGDVVHQQFASAFWPDSQLGVPVFGSLETLASIDYNDLQTRLAEILVGERIFVCLAGSVVTDEVIAQTERAFGALPRGKRPISTAPSVAKGIHRVTIPLQQVHLILGQPWPTLGTGDFVPGSVFSIAFGEGSSSRLFRLLREGHAMTYNVETDIAAYRGTAAMIVRATVPPEHLRGALELIIGEMNEVRENNFTEEEIARAKKLACAQIDMGYDNLASRLWYPLESELALGRVRSFAERIALYESLSSQDMRSFIDRWVFGNGLLLVLGGKVKSVKIPQSVESCCMGEGLQHLSNKEIA